MQRVFNKKRKIMNRIVNTFEKAFQTAKKKNWDKIYIAVDLHETALLPTWQKEISTEYYPYAKESLKLMSGMNDICMILWSCSLPHINKEYFDFFKNDGINFDYINENPECKSTDYADFETKLYFSVGLDDKFGFDPNKDWEEIYYYLVDIKSEMRKYEKIYVTGLVGLLGLLSIFEGYILNQIYSSIWGKILLWILIETPYFFLIWVSIKKRLLK
jgi:hypothetical protein